MSMSIQIQAFIEQTDLEFQKHKKVLLVCKEAKVSLPEETARYFGESHPYDYLLDEKLNITLLNGIHYVEYQKDSSFGYEIELKNLPKGVSKIRFTNNY